MRIEEFKALSALDQHLHIKNNYPSNAKSIYMRKPIYGHGINDSSHMASVSIDGKHVISPAYACWNDIFRRAHCQKLHVKRPSYIGVTVCKEWHSLSNFYAWWEVNQVQGFEIDKDILTDSRQYGPDTCIFIPQWLNCFITDSRAARGEFPIGVYFHGQIKRFSAQCRSIDLGRQEYLGMFDCPQVAYRAWLKRKLEMASEKKPDMDTIDPRIYPRVVEIINSMR